MPSVPPPPAPERLKRNARLPFTWVSLVIGTRSVFVVSVGPNVSVPLTAW